MYKQTIGSNAQVMRKTAQKTVGGVERSGLKRTADGRIVSKAKSNQAKYGPLAKWRAAVEQAKSELGLSGFHLVKGRLLERAREIYYG